MADNSKEYIDIDPETLTQEQINDAAIIIHNVWTRYLRVLEAVTHAS